MSSPAGCPFGARRWGHPFAPLALCPSRASVLQEIITHGHGNRLPLCGACFFLRARLAASKPRPGFYSRHCRVSRDYVAIDTTARYPPAVAGPLPGRDDARLAAGRSRFELYLRHCRDTRDFVSNDTTARCPPAVAGAPGGEQDAPRVLFAPLPRLTRLCCD